MKISNLQRKLLKNVRQLTINVSGLLKGNCTTSFDNFNI